MAQEPWARLLGEARAALGGREPGAELQVTGVRGSLPSHLPVEDTAIACAGAALLAAADLQARRGGPVARIARLDRGHVAAAFRSEAYVRLNDAAAGAGFAPLSRFWRTSDSWVRTHGNYPWHREALLRALGTGEDPDQVAAAVRAVVLVLVLDLVMVWAAESVPVERALVESEPVLVGRVSEDRELGLEAEDFWELGRARVRVLAQARVRDLVRGRAGELAKGPSTFPRSKNRTFRDC